MKIVSIMNKSGRWLDMFDCISEIFSNHNSKSIEGLNRVHGNSELINIFIHDYEEKNKKAFKGTEKTPINISHMIYDIAKIIPLGVEGIVISTKLFPNDTVDNDECEAKINIKEYGFNYGMPKEGSDELQLEIFKRLDEMKWGHRMYSVFEYTDRRTNTTTKGIKVYFHNRKWFNDDIHHVFVALSSDNGNVVIRYNNTDFLHPFNTLFKNNLNIVCECDIDENHEFIFKKYIPENLNVIGTLKLSRRHQHLPKGLKVDSIDAREIGLCDLPEDIEIRYTGDFFCNEIREVPDNLRVGCDLILSRNNITALPTHLWVGNSLHVDNNKLTELNVKGVCRSIYASNNQINEVGLTSVGCELDVSYNKIASLSGIKVAGSMRAVNNDMLFQISRMYVGGDLDIRNNKNLNVLREVIVKGTCHIGPEVKKIDGGDSISYIGTLEHNGDKVTEVEFTGTVHVKEDKVQLLAWAIEEAEKNEDINGRE